VQSEEPKSGTGVDSLETIEARVHSAGSSGMTTAERGVKKAEVVIKSKCQCLFFFLFRWRARREWRPPGPKAEPA